MLLTDLFRIVLASALGFLIAVAVIPPILKVAREKYLYDPPDERKLHTIAIPPLGGVAIFIAFVLSVIFSSHGLTFYLLRYIIAAILLMFFIGLKDDLIGISARKKFAVQVISVSVLIVLGSFQITNLHGLFGFNEINPILGIPVTLFLMIAIINAINLIDGIDGLASGLAMMASFTLGSWFFLADYPQYAIISFALTGSLAGFFLFNVFGNKNKLFMGDTGSLVVGMILALLIVRFNEFNINKLALYAIGGAPSVSFAILMLPLIDTLRVITIRILSGRSPFSPDKNHIHHRLLQLYPNHLTVTLIMVGTNLIVVALALFLNNTVKDTTFQFMFILIVSIIVSFIPGQLLKINNSHKKFKEEVLIKKVFVFSKKNFNINNFENNGIASETNILKKKKKLA